MYCPNCGTEIQAGVSSCPGCGTDPRQFVLAHTRAPAPPPLPQGPLPPSPIQPPSRSGMPTIAVVAIVGGVLFVIVIVIGILAAIAIPNYLRFNAKAKQSEAKVNLGSIFVAEIAYFGENNHYADNFDHLEWQPEGLHYAYFLPGQDLQPRDGLAFKIPPDEPEARPMVTVDAFKVVAVGNIDNDETLDVWVIDQNKNLRNLVDDTRQ